MHNEIRTKINQTIDKYSCHQWRHYISEKTPKKKGYLWVPSLSKGGLLSPLCESSSYEWKTRNEMVKKSKIIPSGGDKDSLMI
jgi:hypothetical protein